MAQSIWLSSWRPLLMLLLMICDWSNSEFPKDQEPISKVALESYPCFQGLLQENDALHLGLDFQRMLRIKHMLYIAARDHVFAVNLTTASEHFIPQQTLTWKTQDVSKCTVRGKNRDECYNYIKVLVPRDDETLFVCGTNAFNPTCRNYKVWSLQQVGEDVLGQARCPFESTQSNVGLFSGGDFYSATTADFLASDAVVYRSLGDDRPVLRSVKYDSKWLREPHFLHAIDYGNYVYFFLREIAVEYTAVGKVVFSRVARVCKNDNGGSPRVLERYWTSFLKARMNCSVPGESFFYFDVLQSLTNVLQIDQKPAVIAVFTTQENSIPGSAVCSFFMEDLEAVFNGRFKEQRSSDWSWSAVPEETLPRPRPGVCAGDGSASDYKSSLQFPDETLTFIKSFPLMDEAVRSVGERPFFTQTSSRSKLTQVVVDVSAGPFKDQTILFLGSDDGRLLKVLLRTASDRNFRSELLEDLAVYDPSRCGVPGQEERRVLALVLDKDHQAVFVAFRGCVVRVPLSRCSQHGDCRRSCLSSRDPYCIWIRTGHCADVAAGFRAGFEQDMEGEEPVLDDSCQADIYATTRNQESVSDTTYGTETHASVNIHSTLLIGCVLAAFFLGAVLSGFMVSCFCGQSSAHQVPALKEAELSLPTFTKVSALMDEATKEDRVGVASQVYSSFIPSGRQQQLVSLADAELRPPQDGDELSALPTPNSSPELFVRNDLQLHQSGAILGAPIPFSHRLLSGTGSSPSATAGGSAPSPSALDELLRHISEVSASGSGGIKVLTSSSSLFPSGPKCHPSPHHHGNHRPQLFSNCHHHSNHHNGIAPQHRLIPQTESHYDKRPDRLVKLGVGVPRHHSFHQRGAPFTRMNTNNSSSKGGGACLTRQHSYSEGAHPQCAGVRRTLSLKPQIPPKPLFLPNAATPSVAETGNYEL
ncbi:semaphorin-6D-like [Gouania willdenowi]|uniref:semaphorin-6D-like n=1 Tax=Gouania willdenowi TaxID=441366 RepID=UPI001054F5D3|nr:semaphorin-6D-like [Gouania willdenowi]XP_028296743.1 semaphorin-6D-like [Gouania willdenowi]